jgi:hypothetical protein
MVDFNTETTMSKAPKEVISLIIIERWYNFQEAYESYVKERSRGIKSDTNIMRARLVTLLMSIPELLKRRLPKEIDKIYIQCLDIDKPMNFNDITSIYFNISKCLDEVELTKIDTKKRYNRANIEEANEEAGFY